MLSTAACGTSEVNSSSRADGSRSDSSLRSSSIRSRCTAAHAARSSVAGMNTRTVSCRRSSPSRSSSARTTAPSGNNSLTKWSRTRATCSTPSQRHAPRRKFHPSRPPVPACHPCDGQLGPDDRAAARRPERKEDEMSVMMVRQKVKDGSVEEAEAAARELFATLIRLRPEGLRYASTRVVDGSTFVALFELDDGIEDPRPAIPEFQRFLEQIKGWVEGPPVIEHLEVVASYNLFGTQHEESAAQ